MHSYLLWIDNVFPRTSDDTSGNQLCHMLLHQSCSFYLNKLCIVKGFLVGSCFLIAAQIGMFYEIRSVYLFLFLAVFYILIQLIYKKISIKSLLKPLLLLLPVSLVLNAYWILPQILSLTNTNASDVVADFFERTTFGNNLYNLAYAFNIHDHSWTGGSLETFHPQTISLIAWIIPVLAFFLILQKRKKTEKLIFWLVAFVFMTFIGKQNAYPSKDSFDLLRTYLPGFRVIRTASLAYIYIGLSYLGIFCCNNA